MDVIISETQKNWFDGPITIGVRIMLGYPKKRDLYSGRDFKRIHHSLHNLPLFLCTIWADNPCGKLVWFVFLFQIFLGVVVFVVFASLFTIIYILTIVVEHYAYILELTVE